MGNIIVRKDHTSIFCPQKKLRHMSKRKAKIAEATLAVTLIISGLAIMILAG